MPCVLGCERDDRVGASPPSSIGQAPAVTVGGKSIVLDEGLVTIGPTRHAVRIRNEDCTAIVLEVSGQPVVGRDVGAELAMVVVVDPRNPVAPVTNVTGECRGTGTVRFLEVPVLPEPMPEERTPVAGTSRFEIRAEVWCEGEVSRRVLAAERGRLVAHGTVPAAAVETARTDR